MWDKVYGMHRERESGLVRVGVMGSRSPVSLHFPDESECLREGCSVPSPKRTLVGPPQSEKHGQRRERPLASRELADVIALARVVAAVLLVSHPHGFVFVVEAHFPAHSAGIRPVRESRGKRLRQDSQGSREKTQRICGTRRVFLSLTRWVRGSRCRVVKKPHFPRMETVG